MTFDAPVVLLLAPLVGGVVWLAATWARRVRIHHAARWSAETAAAARASGRWGPTSLSVAAFLGLLALSGPRWGEERIVAESRGLDCVLVMDISRSMLAEDVSPSRLGRALREAHRLVQDLDGDRLGLVGFAGSSHILAPLTVDGSALTMYLDALDPDVASEGGTDLAAALRQGGELLSAGSDIADHVLVVFTDGEAHDTIPGVLDAAQRLSEQGVHVIFVAEGGLTPARIPLRDDQGTVTGYQKDEDGNVIETLRRDDVLAAAADAAQGTIVAADLPDQAGAVRDLVASYKRARATESHASQGRPRGWIPLLAAACLLALQAATRRTAALLVLALVCAPAARAQAPPAHRRTTADKAWDEHDARRALAAYQAQLAHGAADDTAWYNAGTAALAAGDAQQAAQALARAAAALDPAVRFDALFNLGVLDLALARSDSVNRDTHLDDAARAYREALRLVPGDSAAKWNLELALRQHAGGGGGANKKPPPPSSGGRAPQGGDQGPSGASASAPRGAALTPAQADAILRSIGQEELRARRDRVGREQRGAEPKVKDW